MSRFNTGNPIGSISEEDAYDNMACLDQAMNSTEPTWTDRFNVEKPTIDAALKSAGFMPAGFDFVTGGTLQPGDRNKAVYNPAPNGDNNWYRWNGTFPKEIALNSQPNPKDENNWVPVVIKTGAVEREALRRTYLEAGYNLVEGSFEQGGTLVNTNDVLLHETSGKVYTGPAGTVAAGTAPASGVFVDKSGELLRHELATSASAISNANGGSVQDFIDLFFKNGTTSAVDQMLTYFSSKAVSIGTLTYTGGTVWRYEGHTGQISTKNFTAITDIYASDFGVVTNDVTKADSNFLAIRQAITACLLNAKITGWDAIESQDVLRFGSGEIFIRGNSPLRVSGQELVALGSTSGYRRGFRIVGNGVNNTILTLMSDTGSDVWFYDSTDGETNPPRWGYQYNTYSGITFRDNNAHNNPMDIRSSGQKVNGWWMNSIGWEGWFEWERCQFESLDTIKKLTGTGNDDHGRWNNCKFSHFRDNAFYIDNNQAVALQLIGCEMAGCGNFFNIRSGGWLQMDGSSVICYEPTINGKPDKTNTTKRAFINFSPSSNGGSFRNQKFTFTGLTFETYDENHLTVMASGNNYGGSVEVQFNSCSWATEAAYDANGNLISPPWARRAAVSLEGEHSAWVTFNKCDLNRRHEYSIANKTNSYSTSWVRFTDCILTWDVSVQTLYGGSLANRCKLTSDRGAFQAIGTSWFQQTESGSEYRMFALDFNKILSAQKSRFNPMTFEHRIMDSGAGTWPDQNGNQQRLVLPEGAFVVKSEIYKPAWEPSNPTSNYGISLRRSTDNAVILAYGGTTPNSSEGREFFEEKMVTSPFKAAEFDYVYLTISGSPSQYHPKNGYCSIFYK